MKKRKNLFLLCVFLICFTIFTGCTSEENQKAETIEETTTSNQQAFSDLRESVASLDCKVAVAFIDYIDDECTETEIQKIVESSAVAQKYPSLQNAEIVQAGGVELYAIVPLEDDYLALHVSSEDEINRSEAFMTLDKGEPLILQCNRIATEIDALFSVNNTEKDDYSVMTYVTTEDGVINENIYCYDFSMESDLEYDDTLSSEEFDKVTLEALKSSERMALLKETNNGMMSMDEIATISGEKCLIFYIGTNTSDKFTRTHTLAVSTSGRIYKKYLGFEYIRDGWFRVQ